MGELLKALDSIGINPGVMVEHLGYVKTAGYPNFGLKNFSQAHWKSPTMKWYP